MNEPVYLLPVCDTIADAWKKVRGAKATLWGAVFMVGLIGFCFGLIVNLVKAASPALGGIVGIITQVILFLLQAGFIYISIERARDLPISFKQVFRGLKYHYAIRIIGLYLLQMIVLLPVALLGTASSFIVGPFGLLGTILMVVCACAGIYIGIRMVLSIGMVVEKGINPWPAIKLSFKATQENFWNILILSVMQGIILFAGALALLIGLIWALPLVVLCYGVMYTRLQVNLPENENTTS
ncbi:MAG: hypothetical protein A3E85_02730 [Gammaproteobacteria bacterium RIFCSPHIGHO2_12_FULL_45_12]|nr:MAG: hypothetical protein A3E85_02730 [Gammaproteobacteria bacterium RIFCSPHIGHO2_12_FULL_45_12]